MVHVTEQVQTSFPGGARRLAIASCVAGIPEAERAAGFVKAMAELTHQARGLSEAIYRVSVVAGHKQDVTQDLDRVGVPELCGASSHRERGIGVFQSQIVLAEVGVHEAEGCHQLRFPRVVSSRATDGQCGLEDLECLCVAARLHQAV